VPGDLGVVHGVEEPEEADAVVVDREVLAIDLRGHAPDAPAARVRGEDDALGVLEIRVLLRAQTIAHVDVERALQCCAICARRDAEEIGRELTGTRAHKPIN